MIQPSTSVLAALLALSAAIAPNARAQAPQPPQLLFHVPADDGLEATVAGGDPVPNFQDRVRLVEDGVRGSAIEWDDDGVLAWNAPGNIHAQRGTLSFFWRSRDPVGEAPFVIFRVGYADHSSWDMAWLRIDWNGEGFDAFVTDANLARSRVSFRMPAPPPADAWTHLAFGWDETMGVRLYVDGREVAREDRPASAQASFDYDAGLDQLGLAARVLAPHQVQSRYNFLRGSDFDDIRVYDRMLDTAGVQAVRSFGAPRTSVAGGDRDTAWLFRHGWQNGVAPPLLDAATTTIRKVEFADTKDLKQWMWKATDGIAETTWPGVYNRSRLRGRDDYFQLPDWDTYVEGGQALDLTLPDEPVNRVEIRGAAFGQALHGPDGTRLQPLFERPQGVVRSVDTFDTRHGGHLRFANTAQETPIQEIWAYHVSDADEPDGTVKQRYVVRADAAVDYTNLDDLRAFIDGRFPPDERDVVIALPERAAARPREVATAPSAAVGAPRQPLVHVLVPSGVGAAPAAQPLVRSWAYSWEHMHDGLDGVAIDIPALDLPATHRVDGEPAIPLNIRIKDPIWPARDMIDVSVSVRPGQARTLWLDLRDRILTEDSLWISIASAAPGFDAAALDGAEIRLVYKPREAAIAEHVADRFNQVRDNWGFLVEEHTTSRRQRLYARVHADIGDLLRVDPDHHLGRLYWHYMSYGSQGRPPVDVPEPPPGVPAWAFLQLEDLKAVRRFIEWWIDERQVDFGDFGGGISDDSDLSQQWPGLALMGVIPDKVNASLLALADAAYANEMFVDGLSTIETDELHAYEEGINTNSAALYLNWGDPLSTERLMETVRALDERIVLRNPHGHLLFASNWFGGRKVYREPRWEWQKPYSFPLLHPAFLLGVFNADPTSRDMIVGLADGYLAHAYTAADGQWVLPNEIQWSTGDVRGGELLDGSGGGDTMHLFWAAWRWTGEDRFLQPLDYRVARSGPAALSNLAENFVDVLERRDDWGARLQASAEGGSVGFPSLVAWQQTGDTRHLEALHREGIETKALREYMNTEGHWWSDRVEAPSEFLQRARLGGLALRRNTTYPGHTVSWRFDDDADAERVALLVPAPRRDRFTVIAHNTGDREARATMTGWNVDAGRWRLRSGIDRSGEGRIDAQAREREVTLETSASIELAFAPGQTQVFEFERIEAGTPVERRPDIGIGRGDVRRVEGGVEVTVHSLGHVDAPGGVATLVDARGRELARADIPPLAAPRDLRPRTVTLALSADDKALDGAHVRIALHDEAEEVTRRNNEAAVP